MEMAYAEHYDVEIVNKNFEETVKQVEQKIQEYRYHLEDKQG
jgi:guanylate kinase